MGEFSHKIIKRYVLTDKCYEKKFGWRVYLQLDNGTIIFWQKGNNPLELSFQQDGKQIGIKDFVSPGMLHSHLFLLLEDGSTKVLVADSNFCYDETGRCYFNDLVYESDMWISFFMESEAHVKVNELLPETVEGHPYFNVR